MSKELEDNGKFAAGVVFGAIIGASLAILFAPQDGEKTRKIIKEKMKDIFDKSKDAIVEKEEQVKESVKKAIDKALD